MGPSLLFHLGARDGEMRQFMDQLAGPIWNDLGSPKLTPALAQSIAEGVAQEIGNRSPEDLARERDEALLGLLRLRARLPALSRPITKRPRGGRIRRKIV